MLSQREMERYAEVLFWGLTTARKGPFRKNDIVLIQYEPPALKLAEIIYAGVLDRGLYPIQRMGLTFAMEREFFHKATEDQLIFIPPGERSSIAGFTVASFSVPRSRLPI